MCVKQKKRCTYCTNCTTVWMSNLFMVRWKHKKVLQYVDIVGLFYVCSLLAFFSVNRLGLEPKTPTLKVLCSTC